MIRPMRRVSMEHVLMTSRVRVTGRKFEFVRSATVYIDICQVTSWACVSRGHLTTKICAECLLTHVKCKYGRLVNDVPKYVALTQMKCLFLNGRLPTSVFLHKSIFHNICD